MPPALRPLASAAWTAALPVGVRLAADVVIWGSSSGPLAACAHLATLDAPALCACAPTRLAALAAASASPEPLWRAPGTTALAMRARPMGKATALGSSAVPYERLAALAAAAVRARPMANATALGSLAAPYERPAALPAASSSPEPSL